MELNRRLSTKNPPILCVDCAKDLLTGPPVLSVATPSAFACMCEACAAKYPSREAALLRLRKLLPDAARGRGAASG